MREENEQWGECIGRADGGNTHGHAHASFFNRHPQSFIQEIICKNNCDLIYDKAITYLTQNHDSTLILVGISCRGQIKDGTMPTYMTVLLVMQWLPDMAVRQEYLNNNNALTNPTNDSLVAHLNSMSINAVDNHYSCQRKLQSLQCRRVFPLIGMFFVSLEQPASQRRIRLNRPYLHVEYI